MRMSNTNQIERTAKYFGISIEKAAQMLSEAAKRDAQTHAKGMALSEAVKNGKTLRGGIAA